MNFKVACKMKLDVALVNFGKIRLLLEYSAFHNMHRVT